MQEWVDQKFSRECGRQKVTSIIDLQGCCQDFIGILGVLRYSQHRTAKGCYSSGFTEVSKSHSSYGTCFGMIWYTLSKPHHSLSHPYLQVFHVISLIYIRTTNFRTSVSDWTSTTSSPTNVLQQRSLKSSTVPTALVYSWLQPSRTFQENSLLPKSLWRGPKNSVICCLTPNLLDS